MLLRKVLPIVLCAVPALAQQNPEFQQILDRLERIEKENKTLAEEVRALRSELAATRGSAVSPTPSEPAAAPIVERVAVNEQKIADQAQVKVEASQKFPITLTGMLLFNTFLNGRASGGFEYPTTAQQGNSSSAGGATLSQSVFGLKFQGPEVLGGAHINGSVYVDTWGGNPANSLNHLIRLRVATVEIDWKNTTILAGQDKPIISPREPYSLAQVADSPLTGAGNLWLWQPQVRIDQRIAFGQNSGLVAQAGVYQTSEPNYGARGGDNLTLTSSPRPGIEGRFEFWHKFSEGSRIEIAPGFHESVSHVDGLSAPSRLGSVDWLIQPVSKVQFTGMLFYGENAAGLGGLKQGFTIINDYKAIPVGVNGGWSQLAYNATKRLTFNLFAGAENDHARDLRAGDIRQNVTYGGNAIYRLASNILLGAEITQTRTNYLLQPSRLNNHYDLALGYLF